MSVANWKVESSNDPFYCFLLILNINHVIINHGQLDVLLSSTIQTTPGVGKLKEFQKLHQPDWTPADKVRSYFMQI